jgi:Tol biopolymer transport system component
VSLATGGTQANNDSESPGAISADGRYVTFVSGASNLVAGDTNDTSDAFVRDRVKGTTSRVSVATGGTQADSYSSSSSISGDGRYLAFDSPASNLVAGDTNGPNGSDVFVRDRVRGTTTRVSVATGGTQADSTSFSSSISGDGRYVAFTSWAISLVAGDTNHESDVFVHDRGRVRG